MEYDFDEIEKKCKQKWAKSDIYRVLEIPDKPKYYVLDMFPYPSGAGLHVGHPLGYVATDIFSRYKKMQGFNVLHPMGFDAFGLPAEQYAIETGTHPAATTKRNIEFYREQLDKIGFCYDWNREVVTADPAFYKWTQWIFIQMFNSWYNPLLDKAESIETLIALFEKYGNESLVNTGKAEIIFTADAWKSKSEKEQQNILMQYRLAYLDHADIWWCEALGTVLANDEVKDGLSERGGHPVVRMRMRQWFLRITDYADRLLVGLEKLDWSESMKEMQRNWIGKSEGASVFFKIDGIDSSIEIFTTRPDTIYGATFMVLAPEHPLLNQIVPVNYKVEVETYITYVKTRSERDRQAEVKKITGQFTGAFAINPFTAKKIPVYIAEYVLAGYGTGAIMAVPSNDERDFAFAQKYNLPVVQVVDQSAFPSAGKEDMVGTIIQSEMLNGLSVQDAIRKIIDAIEAKKIGKRKINYRLRDAGFSRQRYWGEPFPVVFENDLVTVLNENELPLVLPDVDSYKPGGSAQSPLAALKQWVNPAPGVFRETDTMPGYAGSSWYFLRYMDAKNPERFVGEENEKYWQDVDLYMGGTEHAVGHLLYSRMWQKFLFDRGWVSKDEPFKKLVNQGMIQGRSSLVYRINGTNTFVSFGLKDTYETTPLHVDIKLVKEDILDITAFKKWRSDFSDAEFILEEGEYRCGFEIDKMSKRYHNVVNPDDVIADYGADCFRMYEMFLGPIEASKPWDTKGISGVSGFLRKLWRLYFDEQGNIRLTERQPTAEENKVLHKCIKKVSEDIERLSFNTAVSAFMIAVNNLHELKCTSRSVLKELLQILAPFAPFVTEELWEACGETTSVHLAKWPQFNPAFLVESTFTYPVSVNGKVRANIELPLDTPKEEIEKVVLALESVLKWTEGKAPKKVIVVPGKIVNVVI